MSNKIIENLIPVKYGKLPANELVFNFWWSGYIRIGSITDQFLLTNHIEPDRVASLPGWDNYNSEKKNAIEIKAISRYTGELQSISISLEDYHGKAKPLIEEAQNKNYQVFSLDLVQRFLQRNPSKYIVFKGLGCVVMLDISKLYPHFYVGKTKVYRVWKAKIDEKVLALFEIKKMMLSKKLSKQKKVLIAYLNDIKDDILKMKTPNIQKPFLNDYFSEEAIQKINILNSINAIDITKVEKLEKLANEDIKEEDIEDED